eukprot:11432770-Alexandrium_andersonii.AAC.1
MVLRTPGRGTSKAWEHLERAGAKRQPPLSSPIPQACPLSRIRRTLNSVLAEFREVGTPIFREFRVLGTPKR